jgi:hypothetical protein
MSLDINNLKIDDLSNILKNAQKEIEDSIKSLPKEEQVKMRELKREVEKKKDDSDALETMLKGFQNN